MKRSAKGAFIAVTALTVVFVMWTSGNETPTRAIANLLNAKSQLNPANRKDPQRSGFSYSANKKGESGPKAADWTVSARKRFFDPEEAAHNRLVASLQVEQRYGRFFQRLHDLPDGKRREIKELLVRDMLSDWQNAIPDSANETHDEAYDRYIRSKADHASNMTELASDLGEDYFQSFERFDQSYAYHDSIESMANEMRSNGVSVDDTLQQNIQETYVQVLKSVSHAAGQDIPASEIANLSPPESAALKLRQMSRFDEQLSDSMSKIMDQPTFEAFMAAQLKFEALAK